MTILLAAAALAAAQAAPAAPVDHSRHSPAQHAQHQHAQHQGEQQCCKEVEGKKVCTMMQGHDGKLQGHGHQGQHGGQAPVHAH